MENMLKEVAATNYRFVSGVDGATLKSKAGFVTIDNVTSSKKSFLCHYIPSPFPSKFSQAGRVTKLGKGMTRLSWNGPKARVVRTFRFGKNGMNGWVNTWGMVGCALSHKKASKLQQKPSRFSLEFQFVCISSHILA